MLAGCSDSSLDGPTTSAQPTEVAEATNFCQAMSIATDAAASARGALSRLYDEMATEDITDPGHDLSVFTAAGADTVTFGTAYITALAQVRDFAEPNLYSDIDAISDYWENYGVPLGQLAADAATYGDFVDSARSLIEAPETVEMRTAQIEATDTVSRAYARTCSTD